MLARRLSNRRICFAITASPMVATRRLALSSDRWRALRLRSSVHDGSTAIVRRMVTKYVDAHGVECRRKRLLITGVISPAIPAIGQWLRRYVMAFFLLTTRNSTA